MKLERTYYKVATPGGWERGFATLEDANVYASSVYSRTGVVAAVVPYTVWCEERGIEGKTQ